ncbi:MAG: response regulator [Actinomycetota bacterium]|nr:response regulator [Actinomycetota bacterium]
MIAAPTTHRDDRSRELTVLVADEDDQARSFLEENLAADRYRVRTAASREQALAILSVEQPDVIVVDVNGKTLGLVDAIRSGDGLAGRVDPDTPLIVLTARVQGQGRAAGAALTRGGLPAPALRTGRAHS